ncbi:MAG: phosphoadenosine phosphosulfate reductase family protein, partial [Vicinamibacterales bacterium]
MSREAREVVEATLAGAEAPCLTSSFQAECVVLTHLLREERPDVPVLFLDTFHHFAETLAYRDELTRRWRLNLITLQAAEPRPGLWQVESTEACCRRHKVEPLFAALERYDAWFTALRRDQSPSRANLHEIEPFRLPSGKVIRRVSPLAAWTAKDVWAYAR